MRCLALAVLAALVLVVVPAGAADAVRCDGAFGRDATHVGLVQRYGAGNVEFGEIDGPEGTRRIASVLFPRQPKRRLEVMWRDTEARARPVEIRIRRSSAWTAPGQIRLGDRFADIEKRNRSKLRLADLDWQYTPILDDWRTGALGRLPGGCTLTVILALPSGERDKALDDNPTEATLRARRPVAREIVVAYPE